MKKNLLFLFLIFSLSLKLSFSQEQDFSLFAVPPLLKDNVAFWKKIYTEVGLHEGVFHDRDYPLVIYKKIRLEQTSGWTYDRSVERQRKHIADCLRNVENQPESTWTEEEKTYAVFYKKLAPEHALTDASSRVRFQLGQKERFRMGLERSTAYLDTIRAIFKKYSIPERLAYLPHVESSFNPESYSRVGAAGLWQFMRSTGRLFLKINYLIDERRDPILSTIAAAKLLSNNFQALGAWPLAITAYNHGVNGIRRAVEATGSRDIEVILENYASPSFQFASKNFYACFLAASDIAMHASGYFSDLQWAEKIAFKNVKLHSYMRPAVICNYLNIPPSVLREFNPAIRPVVFNHQKQLPANYEIRVPLKIASGSMEKLLASVPDSLKSNEPERSEYYTVQSGDNLYGIASRFGVSLTQLARENSISRKNRIYVGQTLRIPQIGKPVAASQVQVASAEKTQEQETPAPEEKPIEPSAMPKMTDTEQPSTIPAPAESIAVSEITTWPLPLTDTGKAARQLKTTERPEQIAIASSPAYAHKKDKLSMKARATLPAPSKVAPPPGDTEVAPEKKAPMAQILSDSLNEIALTAAVPAQQSAPGSKPSVVPKFDMEAYDLETTLSADGSTAKIRVSTDETIGHYAEWLGIPTYRIRQINRMGGRSDIRFNSSILIPAAQPALGMMMQSRLEYHMAIEEDFYGKYKVTDVKRKHLRRGEALWDICNGPDQIPLWLLKKYNKHLDFSRLMAGAVLWVPVVEEKTEQEIREESNEGGGIYPAYQPPHETPQARSIYRMP